MIAGLMAAYLSRRYFIARAICWANDLVPSSQSSHSSIQNGSPSS
jgi:hypothetical protein